MHLKSLELNGFKSFAHKSEFVFDVPIIAIVGPNGSGKSNIVEAIRFVLGEQSIKSMRGKTGSDLIFKGSKDIAKMSRASVTIVFDNSDRVFSITESDKQQVSVDFDEISIGREVYSDGSSSYTINGTDVRMKDVHQLIASINIGSSGHHIISQGEADRYLNANSKDRRELIEEALGLKVYQYRLKDSLKKLTKAEEHLRESELLRKEIAPHLRFLKKQVEKIEEAKHLRKALETKYQQYFQQEAFIIRTQAKKVNEQQQDIVEQLREVNTFLENHKPEQNEVLQQLQDEEQQYQQQLRSLQREVQTISMNVGRMNGMIDVLRTPKKESNAITKVSVTPLKTILQKINELITTDFELSVLKTHLSSLRNELQDLITDPASASPEDEDQTKEKLASLEQEKAALTQTIQEHEAKIVEYEEKLKQLGIKMEVSRKDYDASQQQYYQYLAQKKELQTRQELVADRKRSLQHRIDDRDSEQEEAKALLGMQEFAVQDMILESYEGVTAQSQEVLRREIERSKIRLEDMGGGSGIDTIKEYEETKERDEFLAREIHDVQNTIVSLGGIIKELKDTLNEEFEKGIAKINTQFDRFFGLMFGGGKAELSKVTIKKRSTSKTPDLFETEEEDVEYGVDIKVGLPRKKVSDLDMLSGGERSLTSIALLFALSQVNPPPFLVLDETDAALDEANSQKYGDMVESLSEFSQLILVTHNRETMSRAQTLFGVTLGRNDASTMLSLRLEDAEEYAK